MNSEMAYCLARGEMTTEKRGRTRSCDLYNAGRMLYLLNLREIPVAMLLDDKRQRFLWLLCNCLSFFIRKCVMFSKSAVQI